MSPANKDESGFASRWSRLKQEARAEPAEPAPDPEAEQTAVQAEADAAAAEKTDAEVREELELPVPEGMKMGDDFSAFMSPRVPTRLRNRALRRLWRSNPVLANLDQLNDYDGDFTDAATAGQVVQTAYQVGRGFIDKAAALLEEEAEAAPDGDSPDPPSPDASASETPAVEQAEAAPPPEPAAGAGKPEVPAPTPRKTMRFTFDDGSA